MSETESGKRKHSNNVLPDHITVYHGIEHAIYCCNICGKSFKTKAHFKYHISCLTGVKFFNCKVCVNGFNSRDHLKYHMKVHSGLRPFRCAFCSKDFLRIGDLNRHVNSLHENVRPYQFQCQLCPKEFQSKQGLKAHLLSHTDKRPFICQHCNKGFKSVIYLKRHLSTHGERKFKCNECGRGFTSKVILKEHMRVHCIERPHVCNECQCTFKSKRDLVRHAAVHGEQIYECEVCNTAFNRKDNLTRHRRTYKCWGKATREKVAATTLGSGSTALETDEISDMFQSHCKIGLPSPSKKRQIRNIFDVNAAEGVKVLEEKAVSDAGKLNTGEIGQVLWQAPLETSVVSSYNEGEGPQYSGEPFCSCWVCSQRFNGWYEPHSPFVSGQMIRLCALMYVPFPYLVPIPMTLELTRYNGDDMTFYRV